MTAPRVSQLLPSIRCNSCNANVEFRKLSEHVCDQEPPLPSASADLSITSGNHMDDNAKPIGGQDLRRSPSEDSLRSELDIGQSFSDLLPGRSKGSSKNNRSPPDSIDDEPLANPSTKYGSANGREHQKPSTEGKSLRRNPSMGLKIDTKRSVEGSERSSPLPRKGTNDGQPPPRGGLKSASPVGRSKTGFGSPDSASQPIDMPVPRSAQPYSESNGARSMPFNNRFRQGSGDDSSPRSLQPPNDAFFDMRSTSPSSFNEADWNNPRPAPKPNGVFRSPASPSRELFNLDLERTRPAPRPPGSGRKAGSSNELPIPTGSGSFRSRSPNRADVSDGQSLRSTSRSPSTSRGRSSAEHQRGGTSGGHIRGRSSTEQPRGPPPIPVSPSHSSGDRKEINTFPSEPTGSRRQCMACRNNIGSTGAIHLHETSYHRTCFRCSQCRSNLDPSDDYTELDGLLFCANCTPNEPLPYCAGCNDVITGNVTHALDTTWHDIHLLCAHCRRPLTRGHMEHRGRAYCHEDFATLFLPRCRGCQKPIEKGALVALGGKWHTKCFGCQTCQKPFPDKSFYVFEKQPYCKYHYHALNNTLCGRCERPIEGSCAQVMEGRYHPHCFSCETCRQALKDVYYNFQGRFFCEYDVAAIQKRTNAKAERRKTLFQDI